MQFYEQLLAETEQNRNYLLQAPVIEDVMNRKFTMETYIAFLNQAYHHVKHTIPLLMAAGAKLSDDREWLRKVIVDYIDEEIGHEQWILNDIESCGYNREEYRLGAAPFASEIMVAYLYDYVTRKNPVGIFGMVLVLEGTSADLAPAVAGIVKDELSLSDEATTYLVSHGELDQDHIQFFEKAMNKIIDADDRKAISEVANAVYRLYGNVYRSIPTAAAALLNQQAA
jgi:pyrroloquinoline quinone (PQQ) biosynthesis protein C